MTDIENQDRSEHTTEQRRTFIYQLLTGAIAMVVGVVPLAVGIVTFFDPLRRKRGGGNFVEVAPIDAVPPDGRPYRFPVIASRGDAWNQYPPEPIGSVFIIRPGAAGESAPAPEFIVFSSVCPHLGCSVDFKPARNEFFCPCHNSAFEIDGDRVNPERSPAPRGLDKLDYKIEGNRILVDYRRYKGGVQDKIEV